VVDPAPEIVDIAFPPECQLAVVREAAQNGKHMLCQKPLASTSAEAAQSVSAAPEAGVKLGVNMNMR
jgi:predicted dehydrogenase